MPGTVTASKEKRELEQLEADLAALEAERAERETLLAGGNADYQQITAASARYQEEVKSEIDTKETRWLELETLRNG